MIAEIFSILRDVQQPGYHLDGRLGSTTEKKKGSSVKKLGWIVVMQVCADWRSVAIQTPTLWKHVTWSLGYSWARQVDLHLTIVPNVEDEDIEEVRQLFTVLSKHVDPSGRMPINVDELNVFKVCGFEIRAYPGRSCGPVSLQFEDDNNTAEVMENYFGILPFRPISHVNMTELGWDRWDWQQICGQPDGNAAAIISLTFVERFAPGEFCAFLCSANIVLPEVDAASQPATAALLPLPALSSLTFEPLEWLTLTSCLLPNNDGWLKALKSVVQKLEVE
ncbi:hypothetical protein EWM64_g2341 [Hericium alpestre]|uniref:F-box domain-containing protein n=1 Tax=Hericium alpestre TaxID=135208 RepID=A0A4Z0A5S5_9AGAM|nr:hypothetical protein EWM64_g2341 [Hericium alpestre]